MAILDTILSAGATGLIGNAISTVFSFVNQKQKNKHELELKRIDIEAMTKEAEIGFQKTELEVQGELAKEEMRSFNESIRQNAIDKLTEDTLSKLFERGWTAPFGVLLAMLFGFVDFLKAFIRPGITLYMTIAVTWVYFKAINIIGQDGFTYDTSLELFYEITDTILYVFVSVTLWWFGERRVAKVMNRTNQWKR